MRKTVIQIQYFEEGAKTLVRLQEKPESVHVPGGLKRDPAWLKITPLDPALRALEKCPAPELVRNAGAHLHQALRASERVAHVIDTLAGLRPTAKERHRPPQYPIYFRVELPDLENLPWEALCTSQNAFMGVDDRGAVSLWPIGRQPCDAWGEDPLERTVGTEPRMSLIVAAAQVPIEVQKSEFDAIWASLRGRRGALQLLVSDAQLIEHAQSVLANEKGPSIETGFVADAEELVRQIESFQPNLVHLFCHGKGDDRPYLELETRTDRLLRNPSGAVIVDANSLTRLSTCDSVWLITLNCCEGARTLSGSARSVAHQLATAGAPAVLAMREAIRVEDAYRFSEAFYVALMAELKAVFGRQAKGKKYPMDDAVWARAVRAGRVELARAATARAGQADAPKVREDPIGACAEWTLPVLYLHPNGLRLVPSLPRQLEATTSADLLGELELLQEVRQLWTAAPLDKLRHIDERIREIERDVYVMIAKNDPSGGER